MSSSSERNFANCWCNSYTFKGGLTFAPSNIHSPKHFIWNLLSHWRCRSSFSRLCLQQLPLLRQTVSLDPPQVERRLQDKQVSWISTRGTNPTCSALTIPRTRHICKRKGFKARCSRIDGKYLFYFLFYYYYFYDGKYWYQLEFSMWWLTTKVFTEALVD